jgi:hypothetical protein
MKCSLCGSDTTVQETRQLRLAYSDRGQTRRRRQCPDCGNRMTTYEIEAERLKFLNVCEKRLDRAVGLLVKFQHDSQYIIDKLAELDDMAENGEEVEEASSFSLPGRH